MKNICTKLLAVGRQVVGVKKDSSAGLGYKYTSHDTVTEALAGPLAEHGVYYFVDVEECQITPIEAGSKFVYMTTVKLAVTFVDVESGEMLTLRGYGMGLDPSDKSYGKAVSYALKYVLLKSFGLKTGDDVEADDYRPGKGHLRPKETASSANDNNKFLDLTGQRRIWAYGLQELKLQKAEVEEVLRGMGFTKDGKVSMTAIPAQKLDEILAKLKAASMGKMLEAA